MRRYFVENDIGDIYATTASFGKGGLGWTLHTVMDGVQCGDLTS